MNFLQSFGLAIKNILSSKMRSFLTMLGIIIGVGAVIVIVGLGNGMETFMVDSFSSIGTNLLTINIFGRGTARSAGVDDLYQIVEDNPEYLLQLTPAVSVGGTVKSGTDTLTRTSVAGVSEAYGQMRAFDMVGGDFFTYLDVDRRIPTCVVGTFVANEYFPNGAIGESIKIGGTPFTIVGVLEEQADSEEGSADDYVYIPYTVAMKLNKTGNINTYYITVTNEDYVPEAKEAINRGLEEIYGNRDSFFVMSMSEMLGIMDSMLSVVVTVLTAIAGISLVVGGIGIMNIMLVSVSERTKEIGIRKALGAKQRTIMTQFVIEAATTSAIGGIIGIGMGYALSSFATLIVSSMADVDIVVTPTTGAIAVSFGISVFIGIVFGYLPAKKAARLNPIDALRYE